MEIRAYPEIYLSGVMHTMAMLLDYAVNVKQQNVDNYFQRFITWGFALQLGQGSHQLAAAPAIFSHSLCYDALRAYP